MINKMYSQELIDKYDEQIHAYEDAIQTMEQIIALQDKRINILEILLVIERKETSDEVEECRAGASGC